VKKGVLLNAELSYVIATLGHTDQLVIADAGLPIPDLVERIDLALSKGIPSFIDTARTTLSEMQIESVIMAEELESHSAAMHEELLSLVRETSDLQGTDINIEYVSHEVFKAKTYDSRVIVRTGECTPYANVIFCAGVVF